MAAPTKKTPAQIENLIQKLTAEGRKIRRGRRYKVLKIGITHVYDVITYYDPETKNTKTIDSKLVGKLPKGCTDRSKLEPTNPKYGHKKVALADVAPNIDDVPDERIPYLVQYPLDVVLLVIFLAVMAGYKSCRAIAAFWKAQRNQLSLLIKDFPDKDISHDTIRRLIKLLGGQDTVSVIQRFTEPLVRDMTRKILNLDGQAVRAAGENENGTKRYFLNVYSHDDQLCLTHKYIGNKENEITQAINVLKALKGLKIEGCILTVDALNTQKELCDFILGQRADYCFALKSNHKNLHTEVQTWFKSKSLQKMVKVKEKCEDGHGRVEHRVYRILPANSNPLLMEYVTEWPGLEDGCVVETVTRRINKKTGEESTETRYFITSLHYDERYIGEVVARAIRSHWGIENTLHWTLDVTFGQDRTQCKNGDFLDGKISLNKTVFNFMSKVQSLIEMETGKEAPSKASLMASMSNIRDAILWISRIFEQAKNEGEN